MEEPEWGNIKLFILAYESDSGKKIISKLNKEVEKLKGNNTAYIKEWSGRKRLEGGYQRRNGKRSVNNNGKQPAPSHGENIVGKTS